MKKSLVLMLAMGLVLVLGGVAMAQNNTVSVSASVPKVCRFVSSGSIAFTLDPSVGGLATGTVAQPVFWCSKGTSFTIKDDDGLHESGTTHQLLHATLAETIPYSFTYTTTGLGKGASPSNQITMDIVSTILEANYLDASQGSYSDTVTLTFEF